MLKDCKKGLRYLHALHGWSRFMWPDCIDSKGAILKIDTPKISFQTMTKRFTMFELGIPTN
jgi:hypothetical protein